MKLIKLNYTLVLTWESWRAPTGGNESIDPLIHCQVLPGTISSQSLPWQPCLKGPMSQQGRAGLRSAPPSGPLPREVSMALGTGKDFVSQGWAWSLGMRRSCLIQARAREWPWNALAYHQPQSFLKKEHLQRTFKFNPAEQCDLVTQESRASN